MPDSSNALALALMAQQPKKLNPLLQQSKFGQGLVETGSSTAPVRSPLEGLARALQAPLGAWVQRDAMNQQKEQDRASIDTLAGALSAKDQAGMTDALRGYKGDSDVVAPLLAQLVVERQKQFKNADAGATFATSYGAPSPQVAPPSPGGATPAPTSPNNVGNVSNGQGGFRTYDSPQAGAADVASLLRSYPVQYNNGQPMTLNQIAQRYAPADDGKTPQLKGNNPAQWAANVGSASGLDPNQPLDFDNPAVLTAVVRGINPSEKAPGDRQSAPVLSQGVAQSMDPTAFGTPTAPQQGAGAVTPVSGGASAASAPPEVPRPQPSADQIKRYRSMIESGQLSGAQAVQDLNKEIEQQWSTDKARGLEVWKDQQQSKRLQEQGAQALNQKAPLEMIGKRVDNYETKVRPAAVAAVNDINAIHSVRQILDAGAFTGTGADAKTMLTKLGEQFGLPSDQAVNTQVLGAVLAKRVLAASGGSLGTGFSNADRDFVERASGGQIAMDEAAMRKLADIGERDARMKLKQHDEEVGRMKKLPGVAQLGDDQFTIPAAPTYDEFKAANAPPAAAPSAPAAPAAGGDVLAQARDAIARGAPREQVIQRLKSMGVGAEGL